MGCFKIGTADHSSSPDQPLSDGSRPVYIAGRPTSWPLLWILMVAVFILWWKERQAVREHGHLSLGTCSESTKLICLPSDSWHQLSVHAQSVPIDWEPPLLPMQSWNVLYSLPPLSSHAKPFLSTGHICLQEETSISTGLLPSMDFSCCL